jgi:putative membrane protein
MSLATVPRGRFVLILAVPFAALAAWAAVAPLDRHDWLLENVLTAAALALLAATYRRLPLSRTSYALLFVYLCLHEVGSHYTYALVPYDAWSRALFGGSVDALLGWDRNNYDRVVHFSYGLLLAYPIREVVLRVGDMRGFWGYFLPLDVTMSTSMLYELVEWGVAVVFGGELGMAYLGTQGDVWDAHKDMGLATIGACVAMGITAAVNLRYQRDFARELAESLRVKDARPRGEESLLRRRGGDRDVDVA